MIPCGEKHCLRIRVGGHVQGVCFRHYARMEAKRLGITGWVRNMSDGSVEALICGDDEQLTAMRKWLWHGPETARVVSLKAEKVNLRDIPAEFDLTWG